MSSGDKLITIAIHTYEKAVILKTLLEREGIETVIHNVNLIQPVISSGVRVRIHERDLPMALRIIESTNSADAEHSHNDTVLIPVDFSDYSLKACALGFDFAYRNRGEVVLLYSYLNAPYSDIMPFDSDEYEATDFVADDSTIEKVSNDKMDKFVALIKQKIAAGQLADVKYSTVITEGIPENAILNYSKEIEPKVIVMGTRGKNKKELIGSVTAEVLDAGKFPVLAVPENMTLNSIADVRNVVFFSNLRQQDMISFDSFTRTLGESPVKVTIIPVIDKKHTDNYNVAIDALLNYCRNRYNRVQFDCVSIDDKDFVSGFDKYAKTNQVDLILIPNKKKNIFARLFNPSVAHKILFLTDTPMLVVPV
ncbi:MAG: universal stress protein [Muribaculaceae bacterium]